MRQPGAHRPNVDVGAGRLPRHRLPEGKEGYPVRLQVLAQPLSFRLIRVEGDVHAPAVIEAERAMHRGLTHGAHRQWLGEVNGKSPLDGPELFRGEEAIAIVALGNGVRRAVLILGPLLEILLQGGHLRQLAHRPGTYVYSPGQRRQAEASRDAYQHGLTKAGYGPITTEILDAPEFYYAEDYHQQYLAKNPGGYCGLGGTGVSCPIGLSVAAK